jgi:hypothetical protein
LKALQQIESAPHKQNPKKKKEKKSKVSDNSSKLKYVRAP